MSREKISVVVATTGFLSLRRTYRREAKPAALSNERRTEPIGRLVVGVQPTGSSVIDPESMVTPTRRKLFRTRSRPVTRSGFTVSLRNPNDDRRSGSVLVLRKNRVGSDSMGAPSRGRCFWDREEALPVGFTPTATAIDAVSYRETLENLRKAVRNRRRSIIGSPTTDRNDPVEFRDDLIQHSHGQHITAYTLICFFFLVVTSTYLSSRFRFRFFFIHS